jgi:hypothetical protein
MAGVGMTAGAVMLGGVHAHSSLLWVLASYAVFGVGCAMFNPPITLNAVSGMPAARLGLRPRSFPPADRSARR